MSYIKGKLAVLVLVPLFVFFPTLFFGFTDLDDRYFAVERPIRMHGIESFKEVFLSDVFGLAYHNEFYRPVFSVSMGLDNLAFNGNPSGYHATNLILHIATVILVFFFLISFTADKELSFWLSLLFSVHPALSRAVAWIPGRNDILLAAAVVAAVILIPKYVTGGAKRYLAAGSLAFLVALLTKETAVLLPAVLLFYPWTSGRDNKTSSRTFAALVSLAAMITVYAALRGFSLRYPMPYDPAVVMSNMINDLPGLVAYAGKSLLPLKLTVFPLHDPLVFLSGIALICVLAASFAAGWIKDGRTAVFGLMWWLIFLIPSMANPLSGQVQYYAEQRLYLPLIGVLILLSTLSPAVRLAGKRPLLLSAVVALFSVLSMSNSYSYSSPRVFWEKAVHDSPGYYLSHRGMGKVFYGTMDIPNAEKHFRISEDLNPYDAVTKYNLGVVYMNMNDHRTAEEYFRDAVDINDRFDAAIYNLGYVSYKQGRIKDAEMFWERTLSVNPGFLRAKDNLDILRSR